MATELESNIVSVERVKEYTDTPTEVSNFINFSNTYMYLDERNELFVQLKYFYSPYEAIKRKNEMNGWHAEST